MFAVIILTVVLSPVALAEESPEEASLDLPADPDLPASLDGVAGHPLADVDHEVITDISAYTVHQGQWRLGLVNQDVGLLEHLSVGTTAALWAFSVPNGHAKLTVLDTARLDLAVKGGLYQADLSRYLDMPGGSARYVPLGATASLRLTPRGTVHGGLDLYRLHMEGSMGASDIADTLALLSGTDFDTSLLDVLGDGADVFASARPGQRLPAGVGAGACVWGRSGRVPGGLPREHLRGLPQRSSSKYSSTGQPSMRASRASKLMAVPL